MRNTSGETWMSSWVCVTHMYTNTHVRAHRTLLAHLHAGWKPPDRASSQHFWGPCLTLEPVELHPQAPALPGLCTGGTYSLLPANLLLSIANSCSLQPDAQIRLPPHSLEMQLFAPVRAPRPVCWTPWGTVTWGWVHGRRSWREDAAAGTGCCGMAMELVIWNG